MLNISKTARMILLPVLASAALIACNSGNGSTGGSEAEAKTSQGATTNWANTIVATPEGGWRIGNPDAKVKLVEFASFTCAHCKQFHLDSEAELKGKLVPSGQVSVEYRPFMLNIYDFAAVLLATCEGPERAAVWQNELYTQHDAWVTPFSTLTEAQMAPLRALPSDQQLLGLAKAGKFDAFAKARGMPGAKFEQCLTNEAALEQKMNAQTAAQTKFNIQGTPTFLINGERVDGTSWAEIGPKVRSAL